MKAVDKIKEKRKPEDFIGHRKRANNMQPAKAGCHTTTTWSEIEKEASAKRRCLLAFYELLQAFLNSDSHGDGHADHGHELARRQWRSQGQAQYVPRSVNEEGAPSPTRAPSIANGRRATQAYRCQGARRAPQQDAKEGGSGAGATSVQRLPASALWVLSRRNEKVPPPAGTSTPILQTDYPLGKRIATPVTSVTGSQ